MQRRMYCFLFFLLIKNVLFSQTLDNNRNYQVDKILSSIIRNNEYVISVSLTYRSGGQHIYVIQRIKDSLLITGYDKTVANKIVEVVSLSANDDTLLKKVDMLYGDIKQKHNYQPYLKEKLSDGYFFMTFYEENKLQVFYDKGASQDQQTMIDDIFGRLNGLSVTPFSGVNPRKKYLKIENWNDLLKYLKSNTVDSIPK